MTSFTETIPVSFTDWDKLGSVPRWAQVFNAKRNTVAAITVADELPGIIVLQAPKPKYISLHQRRMHNFVERLEQSNQPFKLVLSFSSRKPAKFETLVEVLSLFPEKLSSHIEVSSRPEMLEDSLKEAFAKYYLLETKVDNDPLSQAKNIIEAIKPILASSGRLSAKAIADEFGMPVAQLARQIGVSRQALSKTPDSPRIQSLLRPYVRIFRLRSIFSASNFLAWLERPNRELDDSSPMDLLDKREADIVADLAEDMLLGAPS